MLFRSASIGQCRPQHNNPSLSKQIVLTLVLLFHLLLFYPIDQKEKVTQWDQPFNFFHCLYVYDAALVRIKD